MFNKKIFKKLNRKCARLICVVCSVLPEGDAGALRVRPRDHLQHGLQHQDQPEEDEKEIN